MKKPIIYKTSPRKKVYVQGVDINVRNPLRVGDRVRAAGGDTGIVVYVDNSCNSYHDRREFARVSWDSRYDHYTMYETQSGLHLFRTTNEEYHSITRIP
jgi:hypothetical protein